MMCATFGTLVITNNDLARGGGTYETPYTNPIVTFVYLPRTSSAVSSPTLTP